VAASSNFTEHPLVRHMESIIALNDSEIRILAKLPMQVAQIGPDQDVVREGDRPSRSFLILDGSCASFKVTGEGKRQIIAFHIPGDLPDLQSLHLSVLDFAVTTLTACKVGFIPHERLRALCSDQPRLAAAFWRGTLIDGSIYREWTTNVGRREASARMAHLMCEILVRMSAVGLAKDHSCALPMTQAELADATGISAVHANRTIQELRRANLISLEDGTLTALDWDGLTRTGDFDPTYLHLRNHGAGPASQASEQSPAGRSPAPPP
jgi:CRP-like cAMP-binding protein